MKNRVSPQDISVGQPLLWDVFGKDGTLLLRRGQFVETQKALDRFIEEGLFLQADDSTSRVKEVTVIEEKPSALQHIMDAYRILASCHEQKPDSINEFAPRMEKLIQSVLNACLTHPTISLASILLLQDKLYSIKHPVDVAILANILAKELSQDEATQRAIVAAALTMNIGMYEVQEKVNSITGPLNDKLISMIRKHPSLSAERLEKLGITDQKWLTLVRQHHELNDGSGYPAGISGDSIQMGARIISIADMYCATVSGRNYRRPQKPKVALRDLFVQKGQKFDVVVASTLIRVLGIYPVGTLVRLKTSEIGVVTGPGQGPDSPAVHVIIGRSGMQLEVASHRKTHLQDFAIEEVLTIDKLSAPIRMTALWGKDARVS